MIFFIDNLPLLFLFCTGWILCWILLSIYRRKRKLIFGDPDVQILFKENSASGHSNKNLITKIGGANNCLKIILTDKELIITPSFLFNLMFLPKFMTASILLIIMTYLRSGTVLLKVLLSSIETSLKQKE